jgi:hypothetical protein
MQLRAAAYVSMPGADSLYVATCEGINPEVASVDWQRSRADHGAELQITHAPPTQSLSFGAYVRHCSRKISHCCFAAGLSAHLPPSHTLLASVPSGGDPVPEVSVGDSLSLQAIIVNATMNITARTSRNNFISSPLLGVGARMSTIGLTVALNPRGPDTFFFIFR